MAAVQGLRPVDPVLTQVGMEYRQSLPWMSGADLFFPWVRTPGVTGTYYIADPLNNLRREDAKWSRSTGASRLDLKFTSAAFRAQKYGFELPVLDDDARDWLGGGDDLKGRAATAISDKLYLDREVLAEAILDGISPTAGVATWNNASSAPRVDVNTASATIQKRIGRPANCMGINPSIWRNITANMTAGTAGAQITEAIKYTQFGGGSAITPDLVAQFFNIDLVVPLTMVQSDPTKFETSTVSATGLPEAGLDVWDKDEVYVAFVDRNPGPQTVSYGMSLGPSPMEGALATIDQYRDDRVRADIIRGTSEFDLKVTCSTAAVAIGDILT